MIKTLVAEFSQRPSSRLKNHVHAFRLREPFQPHMVVFRILGTSSMLDLHSIFGHYRISVESVANGVPECVWWPISDLMPGGGLIEGGHATRQIIIRLWCPGEVPLLLSRAKRGAGFTIRIVLKGNVCQPKTKLAASAAGNGKTRHAATTKN